MGTARARALRRPRRIVALSPAHPDPPRSAPADPDPPRWQVVLATDIAETSVTIPDITVVIDGGLHRAPACDERTGVPHLRTSRTSLAAATQRAGRAGRVRAGVCYHLYLRAELPSMHAAPTAEMLRAPLEGTCLRIRALFAMADERAPAGSTEGDEVIAAAALSPPSEADRSAVSCATLLADAIEPPPAAAVQRAVDSLVAMGALRRVDGAAGGGGGRTGGKGKGKGGELLTELGRRLCALPVEPHLGKALVCAHALGCVRDVSLAAASLEAAHDPFGRGPAAGESRLRLDRSSCALSLVRLAADAAGKEGARRAACELAGVEERALREVEREAARLDAATRKACGGGDDGGGGGDGGGGQGEGGGGRAGVGGGSVDAALAKACVLCAAGPQLMRPLAAAGGRVQLRWRYGAKSEHTLRPHASTVLGAAAAARAASGVKTPAAPENLLCASVRLMRNARGLTALDTTTVSPLAALIFGGAAGPLPLAPPDAEVPSGGAGGVCVLVGHEAVVLTSDADCDMLAALRSRVAHVVGGGVAGAPTAAAAEEIGALRALCRTLLRDMDVPWARVPPGWAVEEDPTGAPLWRSTLDRATVTRSKPTESAARVAARAEAAKGSLARAEAALAERQRLRADESSAAASKAEECLPPVAQGVATAEQASAGAEAAAARSEAAEARAAAGEAREARAREAREAKELQAKEAKEAKEAETAALKAATLARATAAEATEARGRRSAAGFGKLKSVGVLLAECELCKYAGAFAEAGYDDDRLGEVLDAVVDDREGEGTEAVEAMIAAVSLKGGSAVKLRRRLLEPPGRSGSKPGGAGGGDASSGGKGGKGGKGAGKGGNGDGGKGGNAVGQRAASGRGSAKVGGKK